ncbi:MAG: BlaI/MecI/CopY family transcriptional regulator [Actinobacteria bacterium]|nr:MAG: BlaI/MecI/CopY family transcriptional regulator [Actinomycetota bacterium]
MARAKKPQSNKIGIEGIGKLEADIMSVIWKYNRGMTVREVYEDLRQGRSIAYTTIMTVMNNLSEKGLLNQDKAATAYIYTPATSNIDVAKSIVEAVVDKLLYGSVNPLASYFLGKEK